MVKKPPANAGDAVDAASIPGAERSLGGMATHSSVLAWEIPGTGGLAGYSPWTRLSEHTCVQTDKIQHMNAKNTAKYKVSYTCQRCVYVCIYIL